VSNTSLEIIHNNLLLFSRNYPYFKLDDDAGNQLMALWINKFKDYRPDLLEKVFAWFIDNAEKAPTLSQFKARMNLEADSYQRTVESIARRKNLDKFQKSHGTPAMTDNEKQGRKPIITEIFRVIDKYSIARNLGITKDEAWTQAQNYATDISKACKDAGYAEPEFQETANSQHTRYLQHCIGKERAAPAPKPAQNETVVEPETNDEGVYF